MSKIYYILIMCLFCACSEIEVNKESKEDCLHRLYMKSLTEHLYYSKKYNEALKGGDLNQIHKYNDSIQISFGKVKFIYDKIEKL